MMCRYPQRYVGSEKDSRLHAAKLQYASLSVPGFHQSETDVVLTLSNMRPRWRVRVWGSNRPGSPADMKAVMRESSPEMERNEVERPLSCGVSTVRARAVSGRSVSS